MWPRLLVSSSARGCCTAEVAGAVFRLFRTPLRIRLNFTAGLLVSVLFLGPLVAKAGTDEPYPEIDLVDAVLLAEEPTGVAFLMMDYDEEAYLWTIPRLEHYVAILRTRWPELPVAVVSHGDEIFSLLKRNATVYPTIQKRVRHLVEQTKVIFQVCGAFAAQSGVDASDFEDFVEVVDFAPSQITDYRNLDYRIIHLEQVW